MERTQTSPIAPLLLSKREAAACLSVSIRKVDYLIQNKELPTRRIGRRVLIPRGALLRFVRGDHPNQRDNQRDKQRDSERDKERDNQ